MAPRGRRRKVGLTRMDAAIDALAPFGFSKQLVRKTVNALLKVYEGDSGWVFIEDCSYKVLIESILEEQELSLAKKDDSPEHGNTDLYSADHAAVGTSIVIHPEAMVGTDTDECQNDPDDNQIKLGTETESRRLLAPGEDNSWKDISCVGYEVKPKQIDTTFEHLITGTHDKPESAPLPQRRKPCYGWISDDGDEDKEEDSNAMEVPSKIETVQASRVSSHRRRRKSRWDEKPSDM